MYERTKKELKKRNQFLKAKKRKKKKSHPRPDSGVGKTATLHSLCFSIGEFPLSDTTKRTETKLNRYCAI